MEFIGYGIRTDGSDSTRRAFASAVARHPSGVALVDKYLTALQRTKPSAIFSRSSRRTSPVEVASAGPGNDPILLSRPAHTEKHRPGGELPKVTIMPGDRGQLNP